VECSSAFLSVWIEFRAYSGRGGGIERDVDDLVRAIYRVGLLGIFGKRLGGSIL
jgi:hypothetical protein